MTYDTLSEDKFLLRFKSNLLNELKKPTESMLTLHTCPTGKEKKITKILQTPKILQLLNKH